MSTRKLSSALSACALAAILAVPAWGQSEDPVAQEIIALTKAEWAAYDRNDIKEASKNWDREFTQFNPTAATRLDGKAQIVKFEEASAIGRAGVPFAEMGNPKVQVYGDVAILSYNFTGMTQGTDGEMGTIRTKSTRVYARKGGKWMLVHANFGADPLDD